MTNELDKVESRFKHGSLFSGIGGFDLAAEWMGWENVFHCEINPFGQKVLKYYWPNAELYKDITTTDFNVWRGRINVLTGGFPCQDASQAKQDIQGKQGLQGSRTGLFFDMCRAIREIKPKFVVAENVANLLKINNGKDFTTILSELAAMGYNAEWRICRANEQGAPHKRERMYLVAYPDSIRLKSGETFIPYVRQTVTQRAWSFIGTTVQTIRGGPWESEPPIPCVDDGVSSKVVRESIKAFGNAVVPQIPYQIFKTIEQYEALS